MNMYCLPQHQIEVMKILNISFPRVVIKLIIYCESTKHKIFEYFFFIYFIIKKHDHQLAQSDHQQVRIVNLNRRLSGDYQCEVSADAPLFHTDIRSAPLTVVGKLTLRCKCYFFNLSLYPPYNRMGSGNLVLRYSVPFFLPNFILEQANKCNLSLEWQSNP